MLLKPVKDLLYYKKSSPRQVTQAGEIVCNTAAYSEGVHYVLRRVDLLCVPLAMAVVARLLLWFCFNALGWTMSAPLLVLLPGGLLIFTAKGIHSHLLEQLIPSCDTEFFF